MLKRALGRVVGGGVRPGLGLVGRIDRSSGGNTILEIGTLNRDDSWTKIKDGGHIALTPEEREELIEALESHREYRVIELGEAVALEYTVMAVQYLNATTDGGRLRGTILAYSDRKREYAVLTADPYGNVENGTYTSDSQRALNAYITRVNEHLYPHFNASPPVLTFAHVAERDKLAADA